MLADIGFFASLFITSFQDTEDQLKLKAWSSFKAEISSLGSIHHITLNIKLFILSGLKIYSLACNTKECLV